jgi:hypothetical protein
MGCPAGNPNKSGTLYNKSRIRAHIHPGFEMVFLIISEFPWAIFLNP